MDAEYDRRQRHDQWQIERWSLDGTPQWYGELLAEMAGKLTAWREHDPSQHLDPRTDPRLTTRGTRMERRHANW
jgi:hypothetical protein